MKKQLLIALVFLSTTPIFSQFLASKSNLQSFNGYFDFHYDEQADKLYLEVDKLDQEFLYVHSLRTGLGSNDIGLDRGQLGGTALVKFEKAGNKLLLIQSNTRYRANTDNALEKKSIEEAFAKSVLFGFPIKETKGGSYIIDMTPFLMQDTHGVAARLKRGKEGTYKVDKSRSALQMERTKSFPKNSEFEALITYTGQATGKNLRTVAPEVKSISVIQHHSFVELPDDNYTPRIFDPRAGNISTTYLDYATPVQEPIVKRFANRHRLEKKNPDAARSEAVEPIIYYLDPGTPEPVRSALLEGASWWNQAFEVAGFINAFQVKMLPADADPQDVRYNTIQWVHRSTRGWSYGASVTDPRTGEIIKGHVSLGSLRIRQDFLIAQALSNAPYKNSDTNYEPMLEMALARIRQLSAHEVGHTIGFAHNFAASPEGASVMDYPHPTLSLKGGEVNFSNAYATGMGAWDKVTVQYSYGIAPKGVSEKDYLNTILDKAEKSGLRYITDSDARPQGGAHYKAHLWDNGNNAVTELENVLAIRKTAMKNFSVNNIRRGEPYTVLEDVFVPLYFFHRYQTEAAVKLVGGMDYNYAVKGDANLKVTETLDAKAQKEALSSVLKTLDGENLAVPKDLLALFPPRAHGYNRSRESFKSNNGVAFDPLGAAATASDMTLGLLLNPERANRMVLQKSLDSKQLGIEGLLDELKQNTLGVNPKDIYIKEVQTAINYNVVKHMINLALHKKSIPQVSAFAKAQLKEISTSFKNSSDPNKVEMASRIESALKSPKDFKVIPSPKIPDGSPIGCFQE